MADIMDKERRVLWAAPSGQEKVYVESLPPLKEKVIYEAAKRAFDIMLSVVAMAVLLIPMVIIPLVIILDSPGNPLYTQVRLGKNEKPFKIYKFRSMSLNAEEEGIQWAEKEDSRITRAGRFLRKTRLDELPQLINILRGEMSFVGPRPERPEFYDVFDTYIIGFRQRMQVKPGLTGLAQVNGGYTLRPEEKILYDVEYIKRRSILLDLLCVLKTVCVVFHGVDKKTPDLGVELEANEANK